MSIFPEMMISASGMSAERMRLEVIARNIANANTTKTENGGVFRRQLVQLISTEPDESGNPGGVQIAGVVADPSPLKQVYDPTHPEANLKGFVEKPNIDVLLEMVDMMSATRSYEANVTIMQNSKDLARTALDI